MSQYKAFESISLSSTIGPSSKARGDPLTESEEELDPTEFISRDSPLVRVADSSSENGDSPLLYTTAPPTAPKESSESSVESMLTIRESLESELNDSILQNLSLLIQRPGHDNSILQHVQQEYNSLIAALNVTIEAHKVALNHGSDDLNKLRDTLATQFHKLADNQFYLNELYSQDALRDTHMHKTLRDWDSKRTRILSKIVSIKSDKSEYGKKLALLIDENDEIDAEILQLEQKILKLKNKKKILEGEIENTSSVLESKTSKYVELFNVLESRGKVAILETLRYDGLSESKVHALLSLIPVKAGFEDNYERKKGFVPVTPEINSVEQDFKSTAVPGMGMQPYQPDMNSNSMDKGPDKSLTEPEDAYQKGFLTGQHQSEKLRNGLTKLVSIVKSKEPKLMRSLKIDDERNTLKEKLNLEPVLEFLESKSEALSDLARKAGKQLELYHLFERIWRDVSDVLIAQEDELEYTLANSPDPTKIGEIIISSIEKLAQVVGSFNNRTGTSGVSGHLLIVLNNEIQSLLRGLHLLPNNYTKEIKSINLQLISNGILIDEEQKENVKTKRQIPIESSSASDYLFNVSSNAIEHRVLEQAVVENKELRPMKSTLNNKSVKGE